MVNVWGTPVQPSAVGVTVMVATCVVVPLLVAVKDGILPVPLAARPIVVFVFVQENTVPATGPLKSTGSVAALLHRDWLAGSTTEGVGLTVMEKV